MFRWCGVFYLLNVAANPYALVRCELISTILLSESKYFIIFTFLGHLLVIPCKTAKAFIFFNPVVFTESHCYKQVCVTSSYAVALLMVPMCLESLGVDSCISFTPPFPSLIQTGAGSDYISQWTEVTDGRCDQKWVFLAF